MRDALLLKRGCNKILLIVSYATLYNDSGVSACFLDEHERMNECGTGYQFSGER